MLSSMAGAGGGVAVPRLFISQKAITNVKSMIPNTPATMP